MGRQAKSRSTIVRWRGYSPEIQGMVWMFLSTFAFTSMVGFVREASATFNTFEITFWRALFGLLFMVPWLVRVRLSGLKTKCAGMHLTRNVLLDQSQRRNRASIYRAAFHHRDGCADPERTR